LPRKQTEEGFRPLGIQSRERGLTDICKSILLQSLQHTK
jgi:hypothetical protein